MPEYYSMRELNEDSNSCSWPLYYADRTLSNGQCYNGFLPRTVSDAYDKNVLKQKMLEHEAIFKDQVYELHRVYRIQRDLMEEIKRKELHNNRMPTDSSMSSSPLGSQVTPEDVHKWQSPSFPLANNVDRRSYVSGASATASPLSSIRYKNAQHSPFDFQNESSSKNSDALESRPPKARRKLLDLHLLADEYMDTEEGEHPKEENISGMSTSLPDRKCRNVEDGARVFLNNGARIISQVDASRSDLSIHRKTGLTDLNEPVPTEGANSEFVSLLDHTSCEREFRHEDISAQPKSQYAGLPKEAVLNSHHVNGMANGLHLKSQGNDNGWFPRVLQAGVGSDKINIDLCRDGRNSGPEVPERGYKISNAVHLDSASHIPSPYSIGHSSTLTHSWLQGVPSAETPSNGLSQKMTAVQMYPCINPSSSFGMSSQPSSQSFRDGWHVQRFNQHFGSELFKQNGFSVGSSSGSKEPPFHVTAQGYGYLSCNRDTSAASEHLPNHGFAKSYNGLHLIEAKFAKDLNLNAVPPNKLSNGPSTTKTVEVIDLESKGEDILPWSRARSGWEKEEIDVGSSSKQGMLKFLNSSNQSSIKGGSEKVVSQPHISNTVSSSYSSNIEAKKIATSDCPKILGVPIFKKPSSSIKSESNVVPYPSLPQQSEFEVPENKKINKGLDINLPCDPDPDCGKPIIVGTHAVEKGKETIGVGFRHQIDLNSDANENETSLTPSITIPEKKVVLQIDLEAPPAPESEEDIVHTEESASILKPAEQELVPPSEDLAKIAAEAIITISSSPVQSTLADITHEPSESSMVNPLGMFADIVLSSGNAIDSKSDSSSRGKSAEGNEDSSSKEIDYFEMMTLKLTECKEEDYMPEPLVPDSINIEETGTSLVTNRPRRGPARRGRQRRDFQRDILPGLASLSRHEVTEDLQTFGGLMRATGHSWNSRLGRRTSGRNGCARGRRRSLGSSSSPGATNAADTPLIQQLNNIEVGLEDRSLRGWGKTPRRPRRQRCPAGNPPSLPVA